MVTNTHAQSNLTKTERERGLTLPALPATEKQVRVKSKLSDTIWLDRRLQPDLEARHFEKEHRNFPDRPGQERTERKEDRDSEERYNRNVHHNQKSQ